jgi:hypothetical protein
MLELLMWLAPSPLGGKMKSNTMLIIAAAAAYYFYTQSKTAPHVGITDNIEGPVQFPIGDIVGPIQPDDFGPFIYPQRPGGWTDPTDGTFHYFPD